MQLEEILARCDHTLLRPDATAAEMIDLCDEGIRAGAASVCVPPCHVAGVRGYVGDRIRVAAVIGYPMGFATPKVKAFEAQDAVRNGADEIEMAVNAAMVRDACWDSLLEEMRAVRAFTEGRALKLIAATELMTDEEKRVLCRLVSESGADFISTAPGLSHGAARRDIKLLREHCAGHVRVKAGGPVATPEEAEELIALGADRLGESRLARLMPPAAPDPEIPDKDASAAE